MKEENVSWDQLLAKLQARRDSSEKHHKTRAAIARTCLLVLFKGVKPGLQLGKQLVPAHILLLHSIHLLLLVCKSLSKFE